MLSVRYLMTSKYQGVKGGTKKRKTPKFEEIEAILQDDSYEGFCTTCGAWTHDSSEHDADGYECPVCGEYTVKGALTLLLEM